MRLWRRGGVYQVRFSVRGVRYQRTTRQRRLAAAEVEARRIIAGVEAVRRGDRPTPTLSELVALWLEAHQGRRSSHHLEAVERWGRLHLFGLGDLLLGQLDTAAVESALVQYAAGHRPASQASWVKTLRLLVRWAIRRRMVDSVPFQLLPIKAQARVRKILPPESALAWFAAVDLAAGAYSPAARAVRLMAWLGLREGETRSARWEWLAAVSGEWTYTPGQTKGREASPLPVVPELLDYLLPVRQAEGLVLGEAVPRGFCREAMRQANFLVGTPGLTPHRLRGTFATLLAREGCPIQEIQRYCRHKDVRTTLGYLQPDHSAGRAALARVGRAMCGQGQKSGHGGANLAHGHGASPRQS